MKELSIEQKAKCYDDLLIRLQKAKVDNDVCDERYCCVIDIIVPELKESEDEKSKKWILDYLYEGLRKSDEQFKDHFKTAIAWLEKQGDITKLSEEEQNRFSKGVLTSCALSFINYLDAHKYKGKMCVSNGECEDIENAFHNAMWDRLHRYYCKYIEKQSEQPQVYKTEDGEVITYSENKGYNIVEPKFKVGDWITNGFGFPMQISSIDDDMYYVNNDTASGYIKSTDKEYHLWTIEDAKDGDVVVCPKYARDIIPNIFIFKDIKIKDNSVFCYCSFLDTFRIEGYVANADPINTDFYPATKEQRDILFKAMADAGYEFDFEKKELKKIGKHGN